MDLTNSVFGWILAGSVKMPIAHHVGLVLEWDIEDYLSSIVAHYGVNAQPVVHVETLEDAISRSEPKVIRFNEKCKAKFHSEPFYVEYMYRKNEPELVPLYVAGTEIQEYLKEHPVYDVWTSNCQHFVKNFVGDVALESDIYSHIHDISYGIVRKAMFGSRSDVSQYLSDIVGVYVSHRETGICAWNPALDIHLD